LRASESERAVGCPHSLVVIREKSESSTRDDAAAFGTLCHWWKETGDADMPGASPGHIKTLKKKIELSGIRREKYWDTSKGRHEVTFAYNLITLKVKWYKGPREGSDAWKEKLRVKSEWMTGTVDWEEPGGRIDDLKTGRWPVEAQDNRQLYSYAMPWWLELGRPVRYRRPLSITQWERYPLHGLPKVNHGAVSGIQLAEHLQDLQWAREHPKEANPDEEHCRFCEGKDNCPAFLKSGIDFGRY
jgi:hypothetical protein